MQVSHSTRSGSTFRPIARLLLASALLTTGALGSAAPAMAQTAPAASAFGAEVKIAGEPRVGPAPVASVPAPVGDASETLIDVPAPPVLVSGTLTAVANLHASADITSGLTVVDQQVAGPYQARALAQVERVGIVYEVAGEGIPLVSAAVIRSEAVAVCGANPTFGAASEIIDLAIAGEPVPLNAPVQDLIDAISAELAATGLDAVVDVDRNVVTPIAGGGVAIDALVVTILAAADGAHLATVRLAHAELTAGACASPPQCSDRADNDGDGVIDSADPGCHTDGNAANASTYDPLDNDETDDAVRAAALPANLPANELPRTGAASTGAVGAALLLLALVTLAVRRQATAV